MTPSLLGGNVATMIPQRFPFLFSSAAAEWLLSDWWVSCQPWFTVPLVLDSVDISNTLGAAETMKRQQGKERHFWAFCPQGSYGIFFLPCFYRLAPY